VASYAQLDAVTSKATQLALSYEKVKQVMESKGARGRPDRWHAHVERVVLKPGYREAMVKIVFNDGQLLLVSVDVDHNLVNWVKNYW